MSDKAMTLEYKTKLKKALWAALFYYVYDCDASTWPHGSENLQIMTDYHYDMLCKELERLEEAQGYAHPASPSEHSGWTLEKAKFLGIPYKVGG